MSKYPKRADTTKDLRKILSLVTFVKSCIDFDWGWEVDEVYEKEPNYVEGRDEAFLKGWLINTTFCRPDIDTGKIGRGRGRQIYIGMGTSASAVFFSCVVCVKLIVEHEWMEAIRFDGKKVLNPHRTLEELSLPDLLAESRLGPADVRNMIAKVQLTRISKGLKISPTMLKKIAKRRHAAKR